jgi:nicotinate-nucleotide adenylyltransferase
MDKIGIYGGTFNPIHSAHLVIIEEVRQMFDLDKVIFVPSGNPPHKDINTKENGIHRLNMVKLAVKSNKYFEVSDLEYHMHGYSYTKDTLKIFKERYANSTIYFIVGADIVNDISEWKHPEEIFKLCEFIVATRPGFCSDMFEEQLEYLKERYRASIRFCKTILFELSSTTIRKKIENNQSIKYLVTEEVEKYIYENNLYKW